MRTVVVVRIKAQPAKSVRKDPLRLGMGIRFFCQKISTASYLFSDFRSPSELFNVMNLMGLQARFTTEYF